MMKRLAFLLALLSTSQSFALKGYYNLSRSIRALGMGGAFYGLSDDEYALFYNPTGLSTYRGDGQLLVSLNGHFSSNLPSVIKTLTTVKQADELADKLQAFQGSPIHGALTPFFPYYLRKHFGLGLFVGDTKIDLGLLGRNLDTTLDLTALSDSGLVLGYATDFLEETLHIGVNAKAVVRAGGKKTITVLDIANDANFDLDPKKIGGAGGGVDFDLGVTYELPDLPIGILSRASLVLNNVLGSQMSIGKTGENPPGLPRTLSLGWLTVFPGGPIFDNFNFLVDFAEFRWGGEDDPNYGAPGGSFWKHVNFGLEAPFAGGWVTPRVGLMQGYLTAGLGLNLRVLKLDFATYASELSSAPGRLGSRRMALRLQIGWGSAPPAPIVYSARTRPRTETKPSGQEQSSDEAKANPEMKEGNEGKELNAPKGEPKKEVVPPSSQEINNSAPEEPEVRKPQSLRERPRAFEAVANQSESDSSEELAPPSLRLDSAEVPRIESGPKDRFGLDQATQEAP